MKVKLTSMDGDETTFEEISNLYDFISEYEKHTGINFYNTDFCDTDGTSIFDITFNKDELELFSVVQHDTVKLDKDDIIYVNTHSIRPFCLDLEKMEEKYGPVQYWDTSEIVNMNYWFDGIDDFNSDISRWDTRNVESMAYMFNGCLNFNCDISRWDVRKVKNMDGMFRACFKFNQPIGKWNPDSLKSCNKIFCYNKQVHDITNWNLNQKFGRYWTRTDIFVVENVDNVFIIIRL